MITDKPTDEGPREYLVSLSHAGALGCFTAPASLICRRGDRVVLRTANGLDIGTIRCAATPRHAQLLGNSQFGELLRRVTTADEHLLRANHERAQQLFEDARRLAAVWHLPLEILDVAISFDGQRATLDSLRGGAFDEQSLVQTLSRKYTMTVVLRDLALPTVATGCGQSNCGQGRGNCATCSSGGCATGCGSETLSAEVREYFAHLRQRMADQRRVPLV